MNDLHVKIIFIHSLLPLRSISKLKRKEMIMMRVISLVLGIILVWVSGSAAKDIQFPEVIGWKLSEGVQTFVPKTLYEYIDGAADLYLTYDFEELKVGEYSNDRKGSVTVEVYRQKSPTLAFGVYSQERPSNLSLVSMGAQGYIDENLLNFLSGSYYVKINSYKTGAEDREILLSFAKKVLENLDEKGALPPILSSFPEEGKNRNSEKFIARNFLGYSFLHFAFTAEYELSGKKFKLFLMETGGKDECKTILQKYLQQVKSPEKEVTEGRHTLSDPHHGIVDIYWKGRYIWGILDLADSDLRSRYLKLFEEKIEKK
jgi:hypothetical protein